VKLKEALGHAGAELPKRVAPTAKASKAAKTAKPAKKQRTAKK
jgi:hypothetical protein